MSEPTDAEKESTKERMRFAITILQDYVGKDGKLNATLMAQDIQRLRAANAELVEALVACNEMLDEEAPGGSPKWVSQLIAKHREQSNGT